ncbi:DUF7322 domain-containing protein [Natronomonas sp. EA1]|uniref:DUF7322 domain-containing protein n=1 Tax=Natronomonas sp. EA1 TaxID=3421655 RepID=UPI003EBD8BF3
MKLDEEDGWPDEPPEFDPGSIGPRAPTMTDYSGKANELDDETFRAFWSAVLAANYGVFGVTVGPMLVYFLGDTLRGGLLFVTGVIALGYTYYQYTQNTGNSEEPGDDEETENAEKPEDNGETDIDDEP